MGVFLLGLLTARERQGRALWIGAAAGTVAVTIVSSLTNWSFFYEMPIGVGVTLLVGFTCSFLTPPAASLTGSQAWSLDKARAFNSRLGSSHERNTPPAPYFLCSTATPRVVYPPPGLHRLIIESVKPDTKHRYLRVPALTWRVMNSYRLSASLAGKKLVSRRPCITVQRFAWSCSRSRARVSVVPRQTGKVAFPYPGLDTRASKENGIRCEDVAPRRAESGKRWSVKSPQRVRNIVRRPHGKAPIHRERLSSNPRGQAGNEKHHGVGDIIRLADACPSG